MRRQERKAEEEACLVGLISSQKIRKLLPIMSTLTAQEATAFGSRLRRLLERLDRDVSAVYRAAGQRFEPRWYAVFAALRDEGPLTVGELSQRLGITHPAVSQVRTALEREGLVRVDTDSQDGRRHILSLTARGRATARRLAPLWSNIAAAVSGILARHAPTLLDDLNAIENALDRRGLLARVNASLDLESLDEDSD
jgi:DNA-binding MarR family transcriptional regulator